MGISKVLTCQIFPWICSWLINWHTLWKFREVCSCVIYFWVDAIVESASKMIETYVLSEKIPNVTSEFLSHERTRLLNMTLSNLRFNVWRSFVTMATNLPFCFFIQFLEQFLKFLVNFTLLKYVKSQRSYGFLITKQLIFGFQILDLKDHFSASLMTTLKINQSGYQGFGLTLNSSTVVVQI